MAGGRPEGFDGFSVLVVGGGQGLGRQYCLDLAAAGARVAVAGRSATVERVVAEIHAAGGTAVSIIADARAGEAMVGATLAAFGRLDALIMNAGVVRDRSFGKMSLADWQEVLDIHLDAAFACAKAVWEGFRAQGGGCILFTTSGAGFHGNFGQANYAAAKAGTLGLMKTLALEGACFGIRANAIAPMASTEMTEGVFSDKLKAGLPVAAVSPYALALVHPQCRLSGEIIEAGGGWAAAMRWQRSEGVSLETFDYREALGAFSKLVDFESAPDYPTTTLDCLNAAMGLPRSTEP